MNRPPEPLGYSIQKYVSSGAFAEVYKAENKITHQICAIKIIPKKRNKLDDQERIKNEISIQKYVKHQYIAKLIEIKEDLNNFYIISEYCSHGSLANLILKNPMLPENIARKYFIQVAKCFQYLNEVAHIIHRDLKAENIMLDSNYNIKIIDFGLSVMLNPKKPKVKHSCGSPKYIAPEMFAGDPYDSSVDVWSLGVNLYYWVCGFFPFDDVNIQKLSQKVMFTEPVYPAYLSSSLIDLLKRLLTKNPVERIKLSDVLNHNWTLNTNIKNSIYDKQISKKYSKSCISFALTQENSNQMSNVESLKKIELKTSKSPQRQMSIIDKLCATGKFKRNEKIDKENSSNIIVNNAFVSSFVKKNSEVPLKF